MGDCPIRALQSGVISYNPAQPRSSGTEARDGAQRAVAERSNGSQSSSYRVSKPTG